MLNKLIFYFLIVTLLAGCSSNNKFASSFGKRRYSKGYYTDVAAAISKPITTHNKAAPVDGRAQKTNTARASTGNQYTIVDKQIHTFTAQVARQKNILAPIINRVGLLSDLLLPPINKNDPNYIKNEGPDPGRQGFFIELGGIALFVLLTLVSNSLPAIGSIGAIAGVLVFITGFVFCIISLTYPDDNYHALAILGLIIGVVAVVLLVTVFK